MITHMRQRFLVFNIMIAFCVLLLIIFLCRTPSYVQGGGKEDTYSMDDYYEYTGVQEIEILKDLLKYYKYQPNEMNAIEIGGGIGTRSIKVYHKLFKNLTVVEPDENFISLLENTLKQSNINNITIKPVTCEDLELDEKYDICLFAASLLWVDSKDKCLTTLYNALNKDGLLFILNPLDFYTLSRSTSTRKQEALNARQKRIASSTNILCNSGKFELLRTVIDDDRKIVMELWRKK